MFHDQLYNYSRPRPIRPGPRWMRFLCVVLGTGWPLTVGAQGTVTLPELTVYSPRVANQSPAGAFAMTVSALRFEPRVDIQGRNLAEGQADITIRGGIFENTGFQLGAVTILDPQTGHYLAELPVAPVFLGAPKVVTGADLALGAANATVGALAYEWRPVRTAGAAAVSVGENNLRRAEIYQGFSGGPAAAPRGVGVDVALAQSASDGAVAFGEHEFKRANLRLQLSAKTTQTDFFAGYQDKQFGWPNLYTPFNSNETEKIETALFVVNHRVDLGAGDRLEAAVFHRRNKDDYAFNRFAAVGPVHPFQHTTWLRGGSVNGHRTMGGLGLDFRGEVLADQINSTSLTAGRYRTRTLTKLALRGAKEWTPAAGGRALVRAGLTHDDTNRDGGKFSPVLEIARELTSPGLRRIYASYTETSQVPTYTALNSNATAGLFRGNPNLGRAASHNLEAGVAGAWSGWTTEAAVFYRRDVALVDWTFRRGVVARTANPVDLNVAGFECVARRTWSACEVVVGYTTLHKAADYRGAVVDASFYALNYARHRLTAAFLVRLGHGFELRIDNAARMQADNLLRIVGGDDALLSAVGLSFRPAAVRGLEFSVQADNLWNSAYQEVPAVPASPRQVSVTASFAW